MVRSLAPGRRATLMALVMVMVLAASGCYRTRVDHHEQTSPATRPWFCNAAGDGTPASGHGNGSHVHAAYEGTTKGPLSWDDCRMLGAQLDAALAFAGRWPTKGAAEGDGWRQLAPYVPGLGTHHVRGAALAGAGFDPAVPQFLIYGGTDPSAPLVGIAYSSYNSAAGPPEGFAGGNDWYHLHQRICLRFKPDRSFDILAGAEEIPDEECAAQGGQQTPIPGGGLLLLHAWVVPGVEYRPDLFSSGHPCLGNAGIQPSSDPCWEHAWRDPALVTPTTHGHG